MNNPETNPLDTTNPTSTEPEVDVTPPVQEPTPTEEPTPVPTEPVEAETKEPETTDETVEQPGVHTFDATASSADIVNHLSETFGSEEDAVHFATFLDTQDLTDLPTELLKEKYGDEGYVKIVNAISEEQAAVETKTKEITATVTEAVGGTEKWAEIVSFANTELPDGELASYRTMIAQGGENATAAAKALKALYTTSSKTNTKEGKQMTAQYTHGSSTTSPTARPADYMSQQEAGAAATAALKLTDARAQRVELDRVQEVRGRSMAYEASQG